MRNFNLRGRRKTLMERFAEDALHSWNPWQAQQHFGDVHVHFSWPAQRFRRVELRFFANLILDSASNGEKCEEGANFV